MNYTCKSSYFPTISKSLCYDYTTMCALLYRYCTSRYPHMCRQQLVHFRSGGWLSLVRNPELWYGETVFFFYGPMTIMIRILYLPDLPRPVWKKPQIVDPHGGNDHQLVAGIGRVPKLGMVESPGKEVGLCLKKHKKHIRYRST